MLADIQTQQGTFLFAFLSWLFRIDGPQQYVWRTMIISSAHLAKERKSSLLIKKLFTLDMSAINSIQMLTSNRLVWRLIIMNDLQTQAAQREAIHNR